MAWPELAAFGIVLSRIRLVGMLEEPWRPEGRDDLIFRKTGDEWLLYDPASDDIHVLNLTAALVWSFCNGEHEVDEIRAQVAGAFDTTGSEDDVQDILDEFQAAGLLVDS